METPNPSKETNPSGSATPTGDKPQTDQVSKAEYEKLEANYKNLQRELEKSRKGSKPDASLMSRFEALERKLDRLGMYVEPLVDTAASQVEGEDHPLKKAVRQGRELSSQEKALEDARKEDERNYLSRINAALTEAGVVDRNDARLTPIHEAWNRGDFDDALVEARLLSRLPKETPMDEKALEEKVSKLVEERVHKALQEKGHFTLDTKTGLPASTAISGESMRKLRERMERGDESAFDEWRKGVRSGVFDDAIRKKLTEEA